VAPCGASGRREYGPISVTSGCKTSPLAQEAVRVRGSFSLTTDARLTINHVTRPESGAIKNARPHTAAHAFPVNGTAICQDRSARRPCWQRQRPDTALCEPFCRVTLRRVYISHGLAHLGLACSEFLRPYQLSIVQEIRSGPASPRDGVATTGVQERSTNVASA
jgi:hypothetical protein